MFRGRRNAAIFFEERAQRKEQRTAVRHLSDVFNLPEEEFAQNYKICEEMVHYLCATLHEDLAPKNGDGYPVHIKVLTGLKILINGHYQRGVGQDQNLSIGQTTVAKYLAQFVNAVNSRLKTQWIVFPGTEASRQRVARRFEDKYGLPGVLGAIDCTHVQLFTPFKPYHVQYMNRHGYTSINVQLIADADCRILNVNAEYPGSVHDQFIFNNSVVKPELQRLYDTQGRHYFLLGDSGYALEPWMMTPIRHAPHNTPEFRYTQWHCHVRNIIERTNGYLKGTYRMLGIDRSLHYAPQKASKIIYAACTLYNIMKHFRSPMVLVNQPVLEEPEDPVQPNPGLLADALSRRSTIVQTYFNN